MDDDSVYQILFHTRVSTVGPRCHFPVIQSNTTRRNTDQPITNCRMEINAVIPSPNGSIPQSFANSRSSIHTTNLHDSTQYHSTERDSHHN